MKKTLTLLAAIFAFSVASNAELSLKNPCADGMVIQRNADAVIWGFASPGASISITPSWSGRKYRAKADADGKWKVSVATPDGSFTRHSIRVKGDGGTRTISNVLVGEVWYASGQSNMEMPLRGWPNCQIDNQQEHISAPADSDGVRMFIVPKDMSYEPVKDVDGRWWYSSPSERAEMSATAYFFAKTLRETLNVPIGIINSSYGGTMLECWAPKSIAEKWGLPVDEESLANTPIWDRQTTQFNKMVSPCIGYTIKGMIWYQGCSNVGRCDDYAQRFADIIAEYRANWGVGEFPVYLAEIAPYDYGYNQSPLLRVQQWKSAEITPNCEVIPTNDLVHEYERKNIHPGNKLEVGRRLAYLALNRDYGFRDIKCHAPKAISARISNPGEIAVRIVNAGNAFRMDYDIEGLEVAGPDGQFFPVRTFRFDDTCGEMFIRHGSVPEPKYVRYCWGDWILGNLISCDGFPMQTFCISAE